MELANKKDNLFLYLGLLILVLGPIFFLGISNHGLWPKDEPRVAEIGREMYLSGNWAVPTLNQKVFLEKPPLYFGCVALVFKICGGVSDTLVRIPSALFGLAGAVFAFLLARKLFSIRLGLISAFVLATSTGYFGLAHRCIIDPSLAFFTIAGMYFFICGYLEDSSWPKFFRYCLFYLAVSLGFLCKGFIALVIPAIGVLAFLLWDRNLKEILRLRPWWGLGIFLAVTLPWFLAIWHQGGQDYFRIFFIDNHLNRFLPKATYIHIQPWYFYLTALPSFFIPWSLFLLPVLYQYFSNKLKVGSNSSKGILFLKCWFLGGLVFLSMSSGKRNLYLLPIIAPVSILTALWLEATIKTTPLKKLEQVFLWLFMLTLLGASIMIPIEYSKLTAGWSIGLVSITVLIIGLAVVGIKYLRAKKMRQFWVCACATVFCMLVVFSVLFVPVMDKDRNYAPFCRKVMQIVGPKGKLYSFQANETLRGIVPFYTGIYMEEIWLKDALSNILASKETVFVVMRDKKRKGLEIEISSMQQAFKITSADIDGDRCLLFSNKNIK